MTPLVLVHGFMGGSAQWSGQQRLHGGGSKVIAVDLPGFGANHAALSPHTIADHAHFVLDKLAEQGVNSFDLLGHSMGGMIVQEMTALAPDRVRKLVLYGTGACSNPAGRFETYEESKRRADHDGASATARRIAATWFVNGTQAPAYEACAKIAEMASLQAIHAGIDAFGNWSRVENLAAINSPTLIIWGQHDRSYQWSQIEQLWRTIPAASLAVVPGCAHAVHLEKPSLFNALLEDFLGTG